MVERSPLSARVLLGMALVSASLLAWQVLLTRVCALRLHFHFGFLVISNCLLGLGASGTLLTLLEARLRSDAARFTARLTVAYLASLAFTWAFALAFEVPDRLDFAQGSRFLRFSVFNLGLAIPFFTGGAVIGALLATRADRAHAMYGADLGGAALGCVACPALLWRFGAGGTFAFVVLLGALGLVALAPDRRLSFAGLGLAAACVAAMPGLDRWLPVPGKGVLDLTRAQRIQIGPRPEYSRWSANSRIDLLSLPRASRAMFGLGRKERMSLLPEQKLILQDGDAGTVLTNFSDTPEKLEILSETLYSTALSIAREPRVLVIGLGGGSDVWAALHAGAKRVRAIELNAAIVEIHERVAPQFSRRMTADPRVELLIDEGRSALARESGQWDLVQMTGIDTWTSLSSGAYVLAENYLYTQEAFGAMLDTVRDGGLLQISRLAAETETLRLLVNLEHAFALRGLSGFDRSVACFATWDFLVATVVKKGAFTASELATLARYAERNALLTVYLPSAGSAVPSRVEQYLREADKAAFVQHFPRDIGVITDDRPYFFNFSRWREPLRSAAYLNEPSQLSQGNPFFLATQLALSAALATLLIVFPLYVLRRRSQPRRGVAAFLLFFASIGLGFIAIEIALIQKLTLLLGPPLYSIVVTLFSVLLFTGIGSVVSERWLQERTPRVWAVPAALALWVLAIATLGGSLLNRATALGLGARIALAVAIIAPLAFALGMPFAYGIRRVREASPSLVPWAWAVNGSASVVGSVLAVIISMMAGFTTVLLGAALVYVGGFVALARAPR